MITSMELYLTYTTRLALVTSIKAIYILLGELDPRARQDLVSFDKLEDIPISVFSRILWQIINTCWMDIGCHWSLLRWHCNSCTRIGAAPESLLPPGHQINHRESRSHGIQSSVATIHLPWPLCSNSLLLTNSSHPFEHYKQAILNASQITIWQGSLP